MEFYDGVFWNRLGTNLPYIKACLGPETHYKFADFTNKLERIISLSPYRGKTVHREYSGYVILGKHLTISIDAYRLTPNDKKYKPSTPWLISLFIGPKL